MLSQNKPAKYFKLPKTFFNEHLLKIDPIELRDELFNGRPDSDGWQLVETLLGVIEHEAKKIRPDADPCIDGPEDAFWNRHGNSKLEHREANAAAALRSIAVIRRLYVLDPWEHNYDSPTVARIALEVMTLIMTAIRGDFLGEYMPFIERGAAFVQGPKSERSDNLNRVIIQELESGGFSQSAKEIFSALEKRALETGAIYQIYGDDSSIGWRSKRGKLQKTSYKSFENRVARIKSRSKRS